MTAAVTVPLVTTPSSAAPPDRPDGRIVGPNVIDGAPVEDRTDWCPTLPQYPTSHFAVGVPAGRLPDRRPVGVQIVGRRFDDDTPLRRRGSPRTRPPRGLAAHAKGRPAGDELRGVGLDDLRGHVVCDDAVPFAGVASRVRRRRRAAQLDQRGVPADFVALAVAVACFEPRGWVTMRFRLELFVANLDASIAFYESALGFRVARHEHEYASLRRGDAELGLVPISQLPAQGAGPGFSRERLARDRGAGVEIVLEVEDLGAAVDAVKRAGFGLVEPPRERPWGLRDFRVADPDGYFLRVTTSEVSSRPT